MTEASKKREEKGNERSVRHTNPRRSSDRRGEADASTILLLERRGNCWINIMPVALVHSTPHNANTRHTRSIALSLLTMQMPTTRTQSLSLSSQRKHPPHAGGLKRRIVVSDRRTHAQTTR
jgi:hypothetical protein